MKKGFHIPYHFDELAITKLADDLIGSGIYEWIEIKWPMQLDGFDPSSYVSGIRKLVEQYKVGVSCHIPTNLDLGQTNTAMRAELIRQAKACIDYASEFGAVIMPLHPATILTMDIPLSADSEVKRMLIKAGERKREAARRLTAEIAQQLAEHAKPYGMTIALENLLLPQEIAHTADDLKSIVELCNCSNVRALYDCGHAHRVGADVAEFVRILGDLICHVHINDNDGSCDLHMQMCEGNIPYASMFEALRDVEYSGALVMETSYRSSAELLVSAEILDDYLLRKRVAP